jgi:fumarate reductase subunit C
MKWGWFDGENPKATRAKLKKVKLLMSAFLITLGLLTLSAYVKIGLDHKDQAGQKYVPTQINK